MQKLSVLKSGDECGDALTPALSRGERELGELGEVVSPLVDLPCAPAVSATAMSWPRLWLKTIR